MIFIVVKFTIRPERIEDWLARTGEFAKATRAEPGNIFFEWSRSVDDPNQFVFVEAFQEDAAEAHLSSDHFRAAMAYIPDFVETTPEIINVQNVPGEGWGTMAESGPRG
jgi:quinol monooxygenase YgiN